MPISKASILGDVLYFIKNDLTGNITDPISASRGSNSSFVMTSYPQRHVKYPILTIKCINITSVRAGMQTTAQDITINLEVRIWARNEREKDNISESVLNRLANIQFTSGTGSVANNLHDLFINSAIEIDEPGESGGQNIKSRIIGVVYKFYNVS